MRLNNEREDAIKATGIDGRAFQTTVFTSNGIFRVSTCYRESSTIYPSWYYETYIYKQKQDKTEDWIADETGNNHFNIVKRILELDDYKQIEDE